MKITTGDIEEASAIGAELKRRRAEALVQYKPLLKVEAWHKARESVRLLAGGNRSGKTTAGAVEVGWWGTETHPYRNTPSEAKILCTGNVWAHVGDPMWAKLAKPGGVKLPGQRRKSPPILPPRVIDGISWLDKAHEIPSLVKLITGATLTFKSCDSGRTKFEGDEFDLAWVDEELADTLVFQEIVRSLIDRGGDLICTFTPLARGRPMMELHEMAHADDSPLDVHETFMSIFDNVHINAKARDKFIATIPEEFRKTRIFGEYLILEGLVYGEWNPEVHELPAAWKSTIRQDWPRILIIDPGYADPCAVLWAVQVPGDNPRYVVYREYYKRRQTVSDVVRDIRLQTGSEPIVRVLIDPSSTKKQQNALESVYEQFARYLRKSGLRNARTGGPLSLQLADSAIRSGIYNMKEFLKPAEEGLPGFQITEDLVNLKRELRRYSWPRDSDKRRSKEVPVDKDNHLLDAVRYLLMSTPLRKPQTLIEKTSSERIWEKALAERRAEHGESITIGGGAYA